MAYKPKLRALYRKKEALEREIHESLHPIVAAYSASVYKMPKTKEELSKLMERISDKDKYKWLDLRIIDIEKNDVFIFGRVSSILANLEKIAKILASGKGYSRIGDVGISFSTLIKFDLGDFI